MTAAGYIGVNLPDKLAHKIDKLIRQGIFKSRDAAIRQCVEEYIKRHDKKTTK